jgi:hypothetical protein
MKKTRGVRTKRGHKIGLLGKRETTIAFNDNEKR